MSAPPTAAPATYDTLFAAAQRQLATGQPQQAQATAERAVRMDGERYEAHVIAAAALRDQKQYEQAVAHLQTALALAPGSNKPEIQRALTELHLAALPPDARRKLDALMLVVNDADRAVNPNERKELLQEFMIRSAAFLDDHSFVAELWMLRAATSLELNYPEMAWIAKYQLDQLGMTDSGNPTFRKIMAQLERRRWLARPPVAENTDGWSVVRARAVEDAALDGDAMGQVAVGHWFVVKNDGTQAVTWFRRAAEQGSAVAAQGLSQIYLDGFYQRGIQADGFRIYFVEHLRDKAEGVRWQKRAATLGLPEMQYRLGLDLMSTNPVEGARWLRRAAAQSVPPAAFTLGDAYRYGKGVNVDEREAMRLYHVAGRLALEDVDPSTLLRVTRIFGGDLDPKFRDGAEALRLALAEAQWRTWTGDRLVSLAMAYAETGDWANALAAAQKFRDPLIVPAEISYGEDLLNHFKNKQPFREEHRPPW